MDSLNISSRNTSEEDFHVSRRASEEIWAFSGGEEDGKDKEPRPKSTLSKNRSFSFVDEDGGKGKSDPKVVAGLFAGTITTAKLKDSEDTPTGQSFARLRKSLSWGSTEEIQH
eukprot:symbB.v1.2.007684.t1/scaffold476.1/size199034/3